MSGVTCGAIGELPKRKNLRREYLLGQPVLLPAVEKSFGHV